MTEESLLLCLELMALSKHRYRCVCTGIMDTHTCVFVYVLVCVCVCECVCVCVFVFVFVCLFVCECVCFYVCVCVHAHRDLCMVANSLLAYASVNHLHYHFLYLDYPLLARRVVCCVVLCCVCTRVQYVQCVSCIMYHASDVHPEPSVYVAIS